MKKPVIGILTAREGSKFAESTYFRRLYQAGQKLEVTLFFFSPADVRRECKQIKGFIPSRESGFVSKLFPWPDVVIDRYRYKQGQAFRDYVAFRKQADFLYANNRLANKWKVHQVLYQDERMHRWLPETWLYEPTQLRDMLQKHATIYLKPSNGTGGRGILRIERKGGQFHLLGRDQQRVKKSAQLTSFAALTRWLVTHWQTGDKLVMQQGLTLDLVPERTADIRLLIQKNGEGNWSVTGLGARLGGKSSATSNLHGGGQAIPINEFLRPHFGLAKTHTILAECHELAHQTAQTIEDHFGRMLELGLDIGIDVEGRVWLIEVNPKPGREIFKELNQPIQYQQALQCPLEYAVYLVESAGK